jgi:glycosyltransferase involved in cell wall biosynthesis
MIEAMACGTPTIAYRTGSVPEVLDQGTTGYIVDNLDEAAAAVQRAGSLNRKICRRVFEERFSARRMCLDYLELYKSICDWSPKPDVTSAGEGVPLLA